MKSSKKIFAGLVLSMMLLFTGCQTAAVQEEVKTSEAAVQEETTSAEETSEAESSSEAASSDEYIDMDYVDENYTQESGDNFDKYASESGAAASTAAPASSSNSNTNTTSASDETEDAGTKDQYNTDPIPEGKPQPVEWQDADVDENKELTCTLLVECSTILNNMGDLTEGKESLVPTDGIIYEKQTVTFYEGESVFDVLLREMQNNRIHMEYVMTPMYNSNYIEGINNLYEKDCGRWSGWMYCVNGWYPNYGCSRYQVQQGDEIEWHYTCDLGRDLGQEVPTD